MAKYLSVLLLILTIISCKKEVQEVVPVNDSAELEQANIASVNGPTTATVNKEVDFNVSWPHTGDHHAFNSFSTDTVNGNTYHIKLFVDASSCNTCTPDTSAHSSLYTLKPAKPGVYYLKFFGKDSTHTITDTLKVK
ncbi:hypothetical protein KHS38_06190 [Mucilaginibacter sp. Bleaf8]|uniref:hypothetical protein n=1 Tax=Mucilaginibacter sp. Bleaf8 TaxID=2834430 RepID=UPI001BD1825F|nr:hypothetical protein [Mucilaginibacter sp. Bleaf8]MBS7563989.1 hypothetical protein [Mucilaginibacter sp. Bleaf8]